MSFVVDVELNVVSVAVHTEATNMDDLERGLTGEDQALNPGGHLGTERQLRKFGY